MRRGAVISVTGLCTAPLFGTLGFWLADLALGTGGGSDTSIANAYMALLIGILAAIVGGISAAKFDLDLPARPTESTDWSSWLTPVREDELDMPKEVTLRYRFRLIPYGQ